MLPDARIKVVEKIHARFGPEHEREITRTLPLSFADPAGYRAVDVRILAVTDANGTLWPSRVTRSERDLRIKLDARDTFMTGEQVFVLTYEVDGAVLSGPTRDELIWQVTGYQWDVPIFEVQVVVNLPQGVDVTKLDAFSLAGKFGDPGRPADMRTLDAERARFVLKRGLVPREGFMVGVVWPTGLVEHVGPVARLARRLAGGWPIALGLAILVGWWWLRRRRVGKPTSA